MGFYFKVVKCLGAGQRRWLPNIVNVLSVTEFVYFKVVNFMLYKLYLNFFLILPQL